MKNLIKKILQSLLPLHVYLFLHAWFKVKTIKKDKKENHFFEFLKLLPQKGCILDIGANIGIMTTHISFARPGCQVLSYEPLPINYRVLEKVKKHFKLKNVELLNYGLGEREDVVKMVLPKENGINLPGLSHVVHESITEFNEGNQYEAKVKRIDDLQFQEPVVGIKLDVENFEQFVLEGAVNTLKNFKPIIYTELWDNENRYNSIDLLEELGYKIYVVEKNGLVQYQKGEHQQQNFIAIYSAP